MKNVSSNVKYLVFAGLAIILLAMGVILAPSLEALIDGYKAILQAPSTNDFDGLQAAGNFGSAFFNSGILVLIVLGIYKSLKVDMIGVHIAALMMVLGFSFYGKNIINIWWPMTGVILGALFDKKKISSVAPLIAFSTALSPVFSVLAFGTTEVLGFGEPLGYVVGIIGGIIAGFLLEVIADWMVKYHNGNVLFNAGFAAGIAGIGLYSVMQVIGLSHNITYEASDYVSGANIELGICLAILFGYLIIVGFILGGGSEIGKLVFKNAKGGNFVAEHGFGASLINMGINGFFVVAFVFATVKGQLAGPVFACIWTAVGFGANGVNLRTHAPLLIGVYAMNFIAGGVADMTAGEGAVGFLEAGLIKAGSRGALLAAIFSCGLSPITAQYGFIVAILTGMLHAALVPNVGILHGRMSLYNNGLSLGLIAVFVAPLYDKLKNKFAK